jgi:hypothetical protein
MNVRAAFLPAAILILLAAPTAHAFDEAEKQQLLELKSRAYENLRAGEYAEAIAAFRTSYRIYPHPNYLFNIALAQHRRGAPCREILEAIAEFRRACADCESKHRAEAQLVTLEHACPAAEPEPPAPEPARKPARVRLTGVYGAIDPGGVFEPVREILRECHRRAAAGGLLKIVLTVARSGKQLGADVRPDSAAFRACLARRGFADIELGAFGSGAFSVVSYEIGE